MNGYQRAERADRADRAAIDAFAFGGRPERPTLNIRLLAFRPVVKGSLRGFANVEMAPGLIIEDAPVLVSNGKPWCTLPTKPQLDEAGKHRVGADGKKLYTALVKWSSRQLGDAFSTAVIEAIRRMHPDALEPEQHGLGL